MSRFIRVGALIATAALSVSALAACGSDSKSSSSNPLAPKTGSTGAAAADTVVIGSANFPESGLIGEIYAQALEAKGIKVSRKFNIGAREVYYPQVESGAITIMPEYNGALLVTSVDKVSGATTTEQVDDALTTKLPASLAIGMPAAAQDKDSVTVTKATADKYHLTKISDLAPVASKLTIGGPPEFKTRTQGLVGLKSIYGLIFKKFQPLDEAGAISVAGLKNGRVDAADLFTTDPSIAANHFVPLQDDKNMFTAQNVVPLYYKAGVNALITTTLDTISSKLDQNSLLQMDVKLSVDKQDAAKVAKDWLSSIGPI